MHTNDQHKTAQGMPLVSCAATSTPASQAKQQLVAFFTNHSAEFLGTIRSYVLRMGLAQGQAVPDMALDVFQEVAVEALDHIGVTVSKRE